MEDNGWYVETKLLILCDEEAVQNEPNGQLALFYSLRLFSEFAFKFLSQYLGNEIERVQNRSLDIIFLRRKLTRERVAGTSSHFTHCDSCQSLLLNSYRNRPFQLVRFVLPFQTT